MFPSSGTLTFGRKMSNVENSGDGSDKKETTAGDHHLLISQDFTSEVDVSESTKHEVLECMEKEPKKCIATDNDENDFEKDTFQQDDDTELHGGEPNSAELNEGSDSHGQPDEDEDTTLSSEAVVDDIELILMPEETQELSIDLSPKLVRVTELCEQMKEDVYRDQGHESVHESDFRKMDRTNDDDDLTDDGGESLTDEETSKRDNSLSDSTPTKKVGSYSVNPEAGVGTNGQIHVTSRTNKIHSGVQTDICAIDDPACLTARGARLTLGSSSKSIRSLGKGGKRLNWKSELTLLPSKTKIKGLGQIHSFENRGDDDYNDGSQLSMKSKKYTSQDALNTSSHFLRVSSLYRTRNVSRNLNDFGNSESSLMLPGNEARVEYKSRLSPSASASSFKGIPSQSISSYQISGAGKSRRQQYSSSFVAKGLRISLPDLSSSSQADNNNYINWKRRQLLHRSSNIARSQNSQTHLASFQKRHSSDDETSSLIDESERCLRSSIDFLLTDENPHHEHTGLQLRSSGLAFGQSFHGRHYSTRRTLSQPTLNDQGLHTELQGDTGLGSPFLPRKICEVRCCKWAKVILPNGNVSVTFISETDEYRDTVTVRTENGSIHCIPFRKVVFAWKPRR